MYMEMLFALLYMEMLVALCVCRLCVQMISYTDFMKIKDQVSDKCK